MSSNRAQPRVVVTAIAFAAMFLLQTVPAQSEPEPQPADSLSPGDEAAFLDLYTDVFVYGGTHLNDTPGDYFFTEELEQNLTARLIERIANESPEMARELDPVIAGPMLGLSSPEDPLTGFDGEPITEELIRDLYGGFVGNLVFNREPFLDHLTELVEGMTPDEPVEDPTAAQPTAEMMRNLVKEELEASPIEHWNNVLESPVAPDFFVPPQPQALHMQPPQAPPVNMTRAIRESPFAAVDPEAWLQPGFQIGLPTLLDHLAGLTDLPTGDLLRLLGLLADTRGAVVERVQGHLSDFPALAQKVAAVDAAAVQLDNALVTLVPQLVTTVQDTLGFLPPSLQEALDDAAQVASRTTSYAAVIEGERYNGTWGVPLLVDVNGDNMTDLALTLENAYARTSIGDGLLVAQPRLTIQRTSTAYAVLASTPVAANAAPFPLNATIAFYLPDGATLAAYELAVAGSVDHVEALFVGDGPTVELRTTAGLGAFRFATLTLADNETRVVSVETPTPPAQITMSGAVDAAEGVANVDVTSLLPTDVTLEALADGPSGRLALRVTGDALSRAGVYTTGAEMRVETDRGARVHVDRQESSDGTALNFTQRALTLANASGTTHATLAEEKLSVLAGQRGSDVGIIVAPVVDGEYQGGTWAEANASGRKLTIEPGKLVFESDIPIGRLRVTVAYDDLSALTGFLEQNVLRLAENLTAFAINGTKGALVEATGGDNYTISLDTAVPEPFFVDIAQNNDTSQYLLSNLPLSTSLNLGSTGLSVGSSGFIAGVVANLTRHLDDPEGVPTNTVMALEGIQGTAGVGMLDATVNMFMDGGIGQIDMVSSNVLDGTGEYVFERLLGNHALANLTGELEQHSAQLLDAVGNLTGGLFGTPGSIKIELIIDGPLCQAFGKDENRIEICFSNVPDSIAIDVVALPDPTVRYNASDVIHELRISLFAPDVEISLSILEIPRIIELKLGVEKISFGMSSRLQGILLTARLRNVTLAAGIEDLPANVTLQWGLDGLTPVFDPDEYIGRVFLFLNTPDLAFMVDIVDIPLLTVGWGENLLEVGIPDNRTIGSIRVQLVVEQLTFLLLAEQVPGVAATWGDLGGTLQTTAPLGKIHVELTVGTTISLLLTVTHVPQIIASWDADGTVFNLTGGKIEQIKLQMIVLDLLIYVQADGVPTLAIARDDDGFSLAAPTGIDQIALIVAKGGGYFNPFGRDKDFVGVYLRPDDLKFGLSAVVRGIEGVVWVKDDLTKNQTLGLDFTVDKDVQVLVNVASSQLIILLDAILWNLAATTSFSFTPDNVDLLGTPLDPLREDPLLQARLYIGTPQAYAELVPPLWAYETAGLDHGITATTLIDPANLSLATKWHILAPLPDILAFHKVTEENIPQLAANVDANLGKIDIRTLVRVPITATQTLHTLVVFTVTNLPLGFSISQGLGTEANAGNPDVTLSAGAPIDEVFLGIRFDNNWYGPRMTEEEEFLDFGLPWVEWHEQGEPTLGFPIWFTIGDIPTAVGMNLGKGDWSQSEVPKFQYTASQSTLDAAFWLDIGILWDTFVKTDLIFASDVGRAIPQWLRGLSKFDASGHLFIQIQDVPAQGVLVYTDLEKRIIVEVPQIPCPGCSERLGKFFFDFNFRLEEIHGDQGCWICTSIIQLGWHWSYGWYVEIARFDFMLKDLKYAALKPGIESDLWIDGEILFDFKAAVGAHFSAGVSLHVKIFGVRFLVFCACIGAEIDIIVAAGFITFQILEKDWKVNYWTWGWPCGWDDWCHKHQYAGVEYTIPGNWRFDLPIEWPPLIEFRGLHLDSSDDGSGIQHYKVFLDPVIMFCIDTYAGIRLWANEPCFGTHIIPVIFYMAYAYITYFSIDGPKFWSVKHKH